MNHESVQYARFIDLSHQLADGMAVAPGLPRPRVEPFLSHAASRPIYAGQAEFEITRLFMVGNTGTSMDSPYHRHREGVDAAGLSLDRLAGIAGLCIDATSSQRAGSGGRAASASVSVSALAGRAVLVRTGWDRHWGSEAYWTRGPSLDGELVERLAAAGVMLVGVDFANVDDTRDPARPAHTRLLAAGIPIVENMRGLERLPREGFRLFAVPLAIRGAAALPVRAFAEIGGLLAGA